jgi:hypothetical protein
VATCLGHCFGIGYDWGLCGLATIIYITCDFLCVLCFDHLDDLCVRYYGCCLKEVFREPFINIDDFVLGEGGILVPCSSAINVCILLIVLLCHVAVGGWGWGGGYHILSGSIVCKCLCSFVYDTIQARPSTQFHYLA